ncbi:hypothetical protein IFM89_034597 [Coptis chinensis]|uniref:Uncharacterized protein n=1 Tax=Coptis chinensis TaxID=261450 RepID=A0A835LTZ6_9MAGN|nr:hypothetical protein IFM89_034597 [Coptis chinensis]
MPFTIASTFDLLKSLGIKDSESLESKTITIGLEEVLRLLKYSFLSKEPCTNVFLEQRDLPSGILLKGIEAFNSTVLKSEISNFKTISMKVMSRRSNRKTLYAEAGLKVESFMKSAEHKAMLLSPELSVHYDCEGHTLGIAEGSNSYFFNYVPRQYPFFRLTTNSPDPSVKASDKDPYSANIHLVNPRYPVSGSSKAEGFVKGPEEFMVPFDDLEERVVSIGQEESLFCYAGSKNIGSVSDDE